MSNGPRQQTDPAQLNQIALDEIRKALWDMVQKPPHQAVLGTIEQTLAGIKTDLAGLTVNISDAGAQKIAGAVRPQQVQGSADLAALFKLMRGPDVHRTGV